MLLKMELKDDIIVLNIPELISDKRVVYRNLQDFPVNDLFDVDKLHTYVEAGRDKTPIGERIKRSKHRRTKTS